MMKNLVGATILACALLCGACHDGGGQSDPTKTVLEVEVRGFTGLTWVRILEDLPDTSINLVVATLAFDGPGVEAWAVKPGVYFVQEATTIPGPCVISQEPVEGVRLEEGQRRRILASYFCP